MTWREVNASKPGMVGQPGPSRHEIQPFGSGFFQVTGRRLAAIRNEIEAELLAFAEAAHSRTFDGGDVDEHVLGAIIWLDEAVALLGVEPFYCSDRHSFPLIVRVAAPALA